MTSGSVVASAYAAAAAQLRGSYEDGAVVIADSLGRLGAEPYVHGVLHACAEQIRELSANRMPPDELARLLVSVSRDASALELLSRTLAAVSAHLRGDVDTRDLLLGRLDHDTALLVAQGAVSTLSALLRWRGQAAGLDPVSLAVTFVHDNLLL